MRYFSTRDANLNFSFQEVILKGIAPDGGLFVPEKIPALSMDELEKFSSLPYREVAFHIFKKFEVDIDDETLKFLLSRAFKRFNHPEVAPVVHLKEKIFLVELFHGPTSAFKDMALQVMPLLFEFSLRELNRKREDSGEPALHYMILVATSGDTGTAALEGFKNLENIEITVLYPKGGVSDLQELQMITQDGFNQHVYGILGDFDDAQNAVKFIFTDRKFTQYLESINYKLSSANSINWGRLLPQVVYYITSYLHLVKKNVIRVGEPVTIAVPTGNFGNILAAYYAKEMGIPVEKLICASNENKILYDFFTAGVYDLRNRKLIKTPSPSMDILISSNLERLLYHVSGETEYVRKIMTDLREKKFFEIEKSIFEKLGEIFYPGWVTNDETLSFLNKIFRETSYLMDPHTSVGVKIAEEYSAKNPAIPIIVASTAHWAKFGIDVYKALHSIPYARDKNDIPELREKSGIEVVRMVAEQTGKSIPENINSLDKKKIIHNRTVPKEPLKIEEELKKIVEG